MLAAASRGVGTWIYGRYGLYVVAERLADLAMRLIGLERLGRRVRAGRHAQADEQRYGRRRA